MDTNKRTRLLLRYVLPLSICGNIFAVITWPRRSVSEPPQVRTTWTRPDLAAIVDVEASSLLEQPPPEGARAEKGKPYELVVWITNRSEHRTFRNVSVVVWMHTWDEANHRWRLHSTARGQLPDGARVPPGQRVKCSVPISTPDANLFLNPQSQFTSLTIQATAEDQQGNRVTSSNVSPLRAESGEGYDLTPPSPGRM